MSEPADLDALIASLKRWQEAQASAISLMGDMIVAADDEAQRKHLVRARRLVKMGELISAIHELEQEW